MRQHNTIFLAYASEDASYVGKLYRVLQDSGLHPWSYEKNLNPGDNWRKKTDEAIKGTRFFLACLSRKSVSKNGEIQKELRTALGELEKKAPNHIYFIPVLIEAVELPDISVGTIHLRDYQAVKVFEEKGLQKLIRQLREQTDMVNPVRKKKGSEQNIKRYITEDRIDMALKLLKDDIATHHPEWDNDIVLLMSRYNNLQAQHNRGVINQAQYLPEKNRITYAILDLIGRLT